MKQPTHKLKIHLKARGMMEFNFLKSKEFWLIMMVIGNRSIKTMMKKILKRSNKFKKVRKFLSRNKKLGYDLR